jgi:hypothetical protein
MEKHSIQPVLEHYGGRVRNNFRGWRKMICPFHDDSHASATVNLDENAFNCFGCGVKGDTYSIIMEQEGIDFREAITFAERITGEGYKPLPKGHKSSGGIPRRTGTYSAGRSHSETRIRSRSSSRL